MRRVWLWLLLASVLLATGLSLAWRFLRRDSATPLEPGSVRVGVVNACGRPYLASSVARELEARGFVVYGVGNSSCPYESTTVIELLDPIAYNAQRVAEHLAVRKKTWRLPLGSRLKPAVRVELDSSRYLEVLVVLGKDYGSFFPHVDLLH